MKARIAGQIRYAILRAKMSYQYCLQNQSHVFDQLRAYEALGWTIGDSPVMGRAFEREYLKLTEGPYRRKCTCEVAG